MFTQGLFAPSPQTLSHLCVQLVGNVTLPLITRTKAKTVEVESSLGSFLHEPHYVGRPRSQLGASKDAPWNLRRTASEELDQRNADIARTAEGQSSLAASALGLKRLPPTADQLAAEAKHEQREVVDVILSQPATVFLPDDVPHEDKDKAAAALSDMYMDKTAKGNTKSARARAAQSEVSAAPVVMMGTTSSIH